jgi:hypothetical protein
MPANTPIYGFTYPCESDAINASAFSTLANQIDAKLLDIAADRDFAIGRYNVQQDMSPNQGGIASGVATPLTNAGSTYVAPVSGIYVVDGYTSVTATTVTYARIQIRVAAAAKFARSVNNETGSPLSGTWSFPGGAVIVTAGQTIDTVITFTGTGTGTATLHLNVRLIVRLA